jgi:hypothetical protein
MKRKIEPVITDEVKAIREKLDADPRGISLTRAEKRREVSRAEAAYLLTPIARQYDPSREEISPDYIRQLIRGKNPRLTPARAVGNTYLFTVDSLLRVRFTKAHEEDAVKTGEKEEGNAA